MANALAAAARMDKVGLVKNSASKLASSFLGTALVRSAHIHPRRERADFWSLDFDLRYAGRRNEWDVSRARPYTFSPTCMGRRAAKIATRKGAQDAKKAKLYGKIGKQIVSAVKEGGPNPQTNELLNAVLSQARQIQLPKDVIERNIKRASEKGQQDYVASTYEAYGVGGVGILIDVFTDNSNRAAAEVRDVIRKGGGKMADAGSVLFNFRRAGIIAVPCDGSNEDEVLLAAMDAGAEDVLEPHEDDGEEIDRYKVVTPVEAFTKVRKHLEAEGVPIDSDATGIQYLPVAQVKVSEDAAEANEAMMEKLLELDDVDAVYLNQDL